MKLFQNGFVSLKDLPTELTEEARRFLREGGWRPYPALLEYLEGKREWDDEVERERRKT